MPDLMPRENLVLRMQEEVRRALERPQESRRWGMVIDTRKCIGCHACTISCVAENKLPPGVVYRPVLDHEVGVYPNVTRKFMPRPCLQCAEPPCVPVCPVKATYKRPDGVIAIDYEQCIGCRYCIVACPYGARTFDAGFTYTENTPAQQPYELLPSYEYGVANGREPGSEKSPVGNARKCHFCIHRVEQGDLPMCVTTCIGVANYFGDLNDAESLVAEMAAKPNTVVLKEELGTKPTVSYLV